jgi:hypothetical protein
MNRLLSILLLVMLVGCTQNTQTQAETPKSPPIPQQPQAQPPPQPSTLPSQPAAPPPEPAPNEFAGKTLETIASSGSAVECDIKFTYQNKPATAKFFMKGLSEMRFEETSSGLAQCQKTITVIRESRRYAGCEGKTIMPSCDWFRSDHSGGIPQQFQNLPPGNVACKAWTYDKSKFATPGQGCSMG